MRSALSSLVVLLLVGLGSSCGTSSQLEGLSLGAIQLEGEHAEDFTADLEKALIDAGARLHEADRPDLVGTLTWEWAGEQASRYPTLVKIFMQSEPEERSLMVSTQFQVPRGAQPQDTAYYTRELIDRIVSRLAAQNAS